MADITIERINTSVPAGTTNLELERSFDPTKTFLRVLNTAQASHDGAGGNMRDYGYAAFIDSNGDIQIYRPASTDVDIVVNLEAVTYNGAASGDNEFIVRHQAVEVLTAGISSLDFSHDTSAGTLADVTVTLAGAYDSTPTPATGDRQFFRAVRDSTTQSNVSVFDGSVEQGVGVAVVEWLGANWDVTHLTGTTAGSGDDPDFDNVATGISNWTNTFYFLTWLTDGSTQGRDVTFRAEPGSGDSLTLWRPRSVRTYEWSLFLLENSGVDVEHVVWQHDNTDNSIKNTGDHDISTTMEIVTSTCDRSSGAEYDEFFHTYWYTGSGLRAETFIADTDSTHDLSGQVIDLSGLTTGASVSLSGAVEGTSAMSGAAGVGLALSGAVEGAGEASGNFTLGTIVSLSGAIAGAATAEGNMTGTTGTVPGGLVVGTELEMDPAAPTADISFEDVGPASGVTQASQLTVLLPAGTTDPDQGLVLIMAHDSSGTLTNGPGGNWVLARTVGPVDQTEWYPTLRVWTHRGNPVTAPVFTFSSAVHAVGHIRRYNQMAGVRATAANAHPGDTTFADPGALEIQPGEIELIVAACRPNEVATITFTDDTEFGNEAQINTIPHKIRAFSSDRGPLSATQQAQSVVTLGPEGKRGAAIRLALSETEPPPPGGYNPMVPTIPGSLDNTSESRAWRTAGIWAVPFSHIADDYTGVMNRIAGPAGVRRWGLKNYPGPPANMGNWLSFDPGDQPYINIHLSFHLSDRAHITRKHDVPGHLTHAQFMVDFQASKDGTFVNSLIGLFDDLRTAYHSATPIIFDTTIETWGRWEGDNPMNLTEAVEWGRRMRVCLQAAQDYIAFHDLNWVIGPNFATGTTTAHFGGEFSQADVLAAREYTKDWCVDNADLITQIGFDTYDNNHSVTSFANWGEFNMVDYGIDVVLDLAVECDAVVSVGEYHPTLTTGDSGTGSAIRNDGIWLNMFLDLMDSCDGHNGPGYGSASTVNRQWPISVSHQLFDSTIKGFDLTAATHSNNLTVYVSRCDTEGPPPPQGSTLQARKQAMFDNLLQTSLGPNWYVGLNGQIGKVLRYFDNFNPNVPIVDGSIIHADGPDFQTFQNDFGGLPAIMNQDPKRLNFVEPDLTVALAQDWWDRGGWSIFHMLPNNPVTLEWHISKTGFPANIENVLSPGHQYHTNYLAILDEYVEIFQELDSRQIPYMVRVIAENGGGAFWWSTKPTGFTIEIHQWKRLWDITMNHFVNTRGIKGALWAYTPHLTLPSAADHYPDLDPALEPDIVGGSLYKHVPGANWTGDSGYDALFNNGLTQTKPLCIAEGSLGAGEEGSTAPSNYNFQNLAAWILNGQGGNAKHMAFATHWWYGGNPTGSAYHPSQHVAAAYMNRAETLLLGQNPDLKQIT